MVDYKEFVPLAALLLTAAGIIATPLFYLNVKIDDGVKEIKAEMRAENAIFRTEMRDDNAIFRTEMRDDNARFRSEMLKTQSDMSKILMKHNGEIAKLNERSGMKSEFDGKRENNFDGPLDSRR